MAISSLMSVDCPSGRSSGIRGCNSNSIPPSFWLNYYGTPIAIILINACFLLGALRDLRSLLIVDWSTSSCCAISVSVIYCAIREATFLLRSSILKVFLLLCMLLLNLCSVCSSQKEALCFLYQPLYSRI